MCLRLSYPTLLPAHVFFDLLNKRRWLILYRTCKSQPSLHLFLSLSLSQTPDPNPCSTFTHVQTSAEVSRSWLSKIPSFRNQKPMRWNWGFSFAQNKPYVGIRSSFSSGSSLPLINPGGSRWLGRLSKLVVRPPLNKKSYHRSIHSNDTDWFFV